MKFRVRLWIGSGDCVVSLSAVCILLRHSNSVD